MSSWEEILENFPEENHFELTKDEQAYIPVYATKAFAADYKDTRCLFALFQTSPIWCKGVGITWKFTSNNADLVTKEFRFLVQHLDEVENFDFIQQTATYNGKQIKWDTLYPEWKYLNNRKVHFQSPSTSKAEEAKPSFPGEFEPEESPTYKGSDHDNSDKESIHSKSSTDEDMLNISNLLQEAETRIVATIQKLTSRPSTPSPQATPSCPTSMLPGSSKLSIPEESSVPASFGSKGKAKEEPLPQAFASSLRSPQATLVPTTTQLQTPPVPKGNPKGIPLPIPPHQLCLGRTGPPQRPPSPPAPPPPPVLMAGNIATPKLLGSTPDPYDGNPTKAQAFWNTLANYYTMNDAVYNTNDKKVPVALTNFKAGTCGGDWASERIAEALAANPQNYGTWAQFQTTFKKQFIPPQVQQEAIKGMHSTYMGNREFNDWYQDWSNFARQSGIDDNTKMYAFRQCINSALQQKLVALSPQPATLPDLIDKAQDLDRSFCMFAP